MAPRKPAHTRNRPRFTTTTAEETIEAIGRIAADSGESPGRILDAAMTHAQACRCPCCLAIAEERNDR